MDKAPKAVILRGGESGEGGEIHPIPNFWIHHCCALPEIKSWLRRCRILKMIATNGFLTALECTKFDFGRGSAPDLAGELTALLQTS